MQGVGTEGEMEIGKRGEGKGGGRGERWREDRSPMHRSVFATGGAIHRVLWIIKTSKRL